MGKKGYHIIEDILMDDGSLFSEEKMRENGLKINFLDYAKLKH